MDFGAHSFYIWTSYAVVAAVIGGLIWYTFWEKARAEKRLKQAEALLATRKERTP